MLDRSGDRRSILHAAPGRAGRDDRPPGAKTGFAVEGNDLINNRQNGRRRGRGGQRPGGGGNPGRPDNGSRIDNRARGNASQLYEKYKSLAADAQRQGDRVNTEYYLQFADHYFRVLSENRPRFEEQQRARRDEEDEFGAEGEDYGSEGEPVRADQYQPQERPRYEDRPRQERPRQDDRPRSDDRPRQEDRPRDERPRYEERARQEERPRYEDRPRQEDRQRQDARPPRDDRPRDQQRDQPQRDQQQLRDQQPQRDDAREGGRRARNGQANGNYARPEPVPEPVEVTVLPPDPETQEATTVRAADMDAAPPRRRGRPRREDAAPVAEAGSGFEADRLPPSLSVSASAEPDTGEPTPVEGEKPRRRRRAAAVTTDVPAAE